MSISLADTPCAGFGAVVPSRKPCRRDGPRCCKIANLAGFKPHLSISSWCRSNRNIGTIDAKMRFTPVVACPCIELRSLRDNVAGTSPLVIVVKGFNRFRSISSLIRPAFWSSYLFACHWRRYEPKGEDGRLKSFGHNCQIQPSSGGTFRTSTTQLLQE